MTVPIRSLRSTKADWLPERSRTSTSLFERGRYADAFAMFSAMGIVVATLSPLYPRHLDYGHDEEDASRLQAAYD